MKLIEKRHNCFSYKMGLSNSEYTDQPVITLNTFHFTFFDNNRQTF